MATATAATTPSRSGSWLASAWAALRPPPRLTLSEWADAEFRLSAESAASPGHWTSLPYQRGILDAITDPTVERVTVKKAARVGYTKMIDAAIAYYMAQDPCPILVVQPTVEDAEGYSKEEIAPMLRDIPALEGLVRDGQSKSSDSTILHKSFPGGVLSLVGANSGRGFRRVSRRVVIFDEVDGYPASAGGEGDPIKLGEKRAEYYWNRKIVAGSTPLIAGSSRIDELFEAGDQRRYHVPCPSCGHMDFLAFDRNARRGHRMRWDDDEHGHADPSTACFECSGNGCVIEETSKRDMLERGEWIADAPSGRTSRIHASFHVWAAYSLAPNTTWAAIAAEFLACKSVPEKLRTFVNTTLGETWTERGEAPDWERLYDRREPYPVATVPSADTIVLTCGVDVQINRFIFEVVAWAANKESWSVDRGEILADTASPLEWRKLDELIGRVYLGVDGLAHPIGLTAVDSGYRAQLAYAWGREHALTRVIVVKGVAGARSLVGTASPVDVTAGGRRLQRAYRVFPVGVDLAKSELYGWLRLTVEPDSPAPPGYCHFPEHDREYFRQLTAEHLVTIVERRTGKSRREWHVLPNRENHALDARIYARCAASVLGIDRLPQTQAAKAAPVRQSAATELEQPRRFIGRPRAAPGSSWFARRR